MSGVKWNPAEGLRDILPEDIRVGDTIRTIYTSGGVTSSSQGIVDAIDKGTCLYYFMAKNGCCIGDSSDQLYLVERAKMKEPTEMGSMVWVKKDGMKYVLIRMSDSVVKYCWRVCIYHARNDISPTQWDGRAWSGWEELTEFNPQPYEWGQKL